VTLFAVTSFGGLTTGAPLTGMLVHAEDADPPRTLSVLEERSPYPCPPLTLRLSPSGTPESDL